MFLLAYFHYGYFFCLYELQGVFLFNSEHDTHIIPPRAVDEKKKRRKMNGRLECIRTIHGTLLYKVKGQVT